MEDYREATQIFDNDGEVRQASFSRANEARSSCNMSQSAFFKHRSVHSVAAQVLSAVYESHCAKSVLDFAFPGSRFVRCWQGRGGRKGDASGPWASNRRFL